MCEKKSPEGGFVVEDFLATIDYSAMGDRREAAEACPPKCIVSTETPSTEMLSPETISPATDVKREPSTPDRNGED